MSSRMYGTKVDLNPTDVRDFYNNRATMFLQGKKSRNTTVLLVDNKIGYADKWDIDEKNFVLTSQTFGDESLVFYYAMNKDVGECVCLQ